MAKKTTTIRISDELAEELELASRTEGVSANSFIIEAVEERIQRLRGDQAFMGRLSEMIERNKNILDRLAR
jgi:predicted transcriptional regulator